VAYDVLVVSIRWKPADMGTSWVAKMCGGGASDGKSQWPSSSTCYCDSSRGAQPVFSHSLQCAPPPQKRLPSRRVVRDDHPHVGCKGGLGVETRFNVDVVNVQEDEKGACDARIPHDLSACGLKGISKGISRIRSQRVNYDRPSLPTHVPSKHRHDRVSPRPIAE